MKNRIPATAIFLIIFFVQSTYPQTIDELHSLYYKKQFFTLRDELKKNHESYDSLTRDYYQALVYSVFNKPAESNSIIAKILEHNLSSLTDSMKVELYEALSINNVNLFQYDKALEASEFLLKNHPEHYSSEELEDMKNTELIWKASTFIPPQTVTVKGDTRLEITKDIAGLTNIEVSISGENEKFIFDTGANFSTIRKSYAEKLGLKFLEGEIKVGTSTGNKVNSNLGIADALKIGNHEFNNVLFLILPDEALTFGGGAYVINAIIGFPVIKEMKEIILSEDEIFIPAKSEESAYQNLAMNEFTPIVETIINSDTLLFSFDTGANKTAIYSKYYDDNKEFIDKNYEEEEFNVGGAGGVVKITGFMLKDMNFQIGNGKALLDEVSLYKKKIKDDNEYLYGNLGNDFIKQFKKMVINFEHMFVDFRN